MKKILLGLFLILGVVSFALPKYVSPEKIKSFGYEVTDEGDFGFRIARQKNNIVFIFNIGSSIICYTKLCKYRKNQKFWL